ncbi:hypothetical protein ONZ45_g13164 [Pleurotus djamor]|nr:hypothetical protein ONZ45_g13164 [Pleurotus djamor]
MSDRQPPTKIKNRHAFFSEEQIAQEIRKYVAGHPTTVDVKLIGEQVKQAMGNRVDLQVTADRLAKGSRAERKALLDGVNLGRITTPTVVASSDGVPLIVYLPHVVPKHIEKHAGKAIWALRKILDSNIQTVTSKKWRNSTTYLKIHGKKYPRGAKDFSPAWYMRGHSGKGLPNPSAGLRKNQAECKAWLNDSRSLHRTINLILGAIHPDSYAAGSRSMETLRHDSKDASRRFWGKSWESVFSALTVISNRCCPPHFDNKGDLKQMDALVNIGTDEAELRFPHLRASFRYFGGSVVLFSGRLFKHEVPLWKNGDRVAYAYFMRSEVHKALGAQSVGWARLPSV